MGNSKSNPKRWYLVMAFCLLMSFLSYVVLPRLGYNISIAHDAGLMIGLWAPTAAVFGVRGELMQKKD